MVQIKIIDFLLELIYPNVCGFCEEINKHGLCENCKQKLKRIVVAKIDNYNSDKSKFFTKHGYLFKYKGEIRKLILDYKFNDKPYLYKTFITIILNNQKIVNFIKDYDIVISVPIHRKRFNNRGYNQSELIAKEISKKLKINNFRNDVLIKIKNNPVQSKLNKYQRTMNVRDVYKVKNRNLIQNKKIILIDDIYTTGSTVNECSRVLKENGAKEIGVFTISKD